MARTVVLLAVALLFAWPPASQPSGSIAGRVVDHLGGALPGTAIAVRAGSMERTTVADPRGGFWITGLPPGPYTVVARLVGFEDASHEGVQVTPGQVTTMNVVLRAGCLGHVDYIDNGLPWVISQSDVIAHIRIPAFGAADVCPASPALNHCACALHRASVLRVLRGQIGQSQLLWLVQDGAGARGQELPYSAGDEFIAFLRLDVQASAFNRVLGPHYMFRVRDGRVDLGGRTMSGFTGGMTVDEFQKAIEAMALRSPQAGGGNAGRITGIATDTSGSPIPGTNITLRWAESEYTVTTDARGAFFFFDVRPGRYAVIASLQGMYSDPHTDVVISPGGRATLELELTTDCMKAPEEATDLGVAGMATEADLVAHIRIPALVPQAACSVESHCSCTLHHATVLRVMKGQPLRELRLLQEGAGYATREQAYAPGDEFVAFLRRDDKQYAFGRLAGPRYMFRVRDGRVDLAGRTLPGFRNGMTVAEFEKAFRAMR